MIRSWGVVTLTGSAQPIFGDVLTAAFVPSPVARRDSGSAAQTVQVASTTRYAIGDRIILGFGQAGQNIVIVDKITDSTHLQCRSEGGAALSAWNNGTIIALDIACAQVVVQSIVGNAGNIWLGSDNTVTNTGGGSAFAQVLVTGSYNFGIAQWNALRTNEAWMAGTASDKAGISAIVI